MKGLVLLVALLGAGAQDRGEELHEAARRGDLAAARALLDAGVPVDAANRYGATALFFAADKGDVAMVELLLARGARLDVEDRFYQMTPFTRALSSGHEDVGLVLLKEAHRARILDRRTFDDVLEQARQTGWASIAEFLSAAEPPGESGAGEARLTESELSELAGDYRHDDSGALLTVAVRSGALTLTREGKSTTLVPRAARQFTLEGSDEELLFSGRGGMVERVLLVKGKDTTSFRPLEEGELAGGGASVTVPFPREDVPAAPGGAAPWPAFRGPNGSGVADGQGLPLEWDVPSRKNIRFETAVPGFSVASPIIWGNRIFVVTAVSGANDRTFRTGLYGDVRPVEDLSEHRWLLLALDTGDGRVVWERELDRGTPGTKRHTKSSQANATPVTDGARVVTLLGSTGYLYCHDFEGNLLWKRSVGVLNAGWFYDPDYQWGHSSSPVIYQDRVIVQADIHGGAFLAAFDLGTGEELWRTPREDEIPTFATPVIYKGASGDELVTNGTRIRGYDPRTGELLWHLGPNSEIPVGSPVVSRELIYITAGYPPIRPIYAVRPGSRGDLALPEGVEKSEALAWSRTRGGTYIPSPLVYRGHFYTNDNNGLVVCYDAATGELEYRARLGGVGGSYAASPIAADGRLYFTSEEGVTFVVEAGPAYRELAKNSVDGVVLSTPAASAGLLVIRTLDRVYGISQEREH